jgi:8-oxo-dGTP pyrophosphatase MutT (NUDIX family)
MKLFIRDAFIQILPATEKLAFSRFAEISSAVPENLKGRCFLASAGAHDLHQVLYWLEQDKLKELEELICFTEDPESLKDFVKREFRVVKAAGGLVRKGKQILLIHRLGKWDLPKGKLEKGEKMKDAAVREVEEECSIRVERGKKICNTWHSYNLDGKRILKKTAWYVMDCLDDKKMKPQKEEGIDAIRWMNENEAQEALANSYKSIREVLTCYLSADDLKKSERENRE